MRRLLFGLDFGGLTCSPAFWIPAFAGMTGRAGMTGQRERLGYARHPPARAASQSPQAGQQPNRHAGGGDVYFQRHFF